MREIALRIGKPTPLTSIVTEPKDFDADKPAVLILNSGVMHHIGTCRLSVKIARALANSGFLALRFDFSGIGDSEPRRGTENFAESSSAEISEVMDYLQRKKKINKFIVYGLCSGADASYEIAQKDPRIIGMIQIDAYCYANWQSRLYHYAPRLLSLDVWLRFIKRLLGQKKASSQDAEEIDDEFVEMPSYIRELPPREKVAKALQGIIDKDIHIYNIFTGGMMETFNHPSQYHENFSEVDFKGLLKVDFYKELDHIITSQKHQKSIPKEICKWVQMVSDKQKSNTTLK
ncbi:MAG: pimeloyl-ACP methyl ester carboxylesterase [Paraglaciecola sp.]|jgi:pimeloyl-ACP methyl ester carboxylesterase